MVTIAVTKARKLTTMVPLNYYMQIAFSSNITFIHVCARYIRYVLPILMQNKPKKFCIEFLKYLMALEITLLNNEDAFLQPSFAYFATLLELPTPWCTNATF